MNASLWLALLAGVLLAAGAALFLNASPPDALCEGPEIALEGPALRFEPPTVEGLTPLATRNELIGGDVSDDPEARLYALQLPGAPALVVLRPLSREEYNAFQVQGIGYELIEQQMLAAAFVHPELEAGDVSGWPPDWTGLAKRALNHISGFTVFEDVPLGG